MKKLTHLTLITLIIFSLVENSFSQNYPYVSANCEDCELNNSFQHTKKIDFEGGNICCDRNFRLVLSDEFDGNSIDTSKWATWYYYGGGPATHSKRLHGNRGSYFKDENVLVGGGICTLRTKIELTTFPEVCIDGNCTTYRHFTSGMLWGKPKLTNFHRYEIRCNSPYVAYEKMWTAFWNLAGLQKSIFLNLMDQLNQNLRAINGMEMV